jgi:RimJ/RimL family protein N-acetyltransferase
MKKNEIIEKIENILQCKIKIKTEHIKNYMNKSESYKYNIYIEQQEITMFKLIPMTGCCGIVVSTGSYINYNFRNKGLGKLFNKLRIVLAREMGYGQIYCTVTEENLHQIKILEKNGWIKNNSFKNPRTLNTVLSYTYNL